MTELAPTLEKYFTDYLHHTVNASPHTVSSYRDTWRLLIAYLHATSHTPANQIKLEQLNSDCITAFLHDLEDRRSNSINTRNNRLAAIHSFFAYAATLHPDHAALIGRVLAIPTKRHQQIEVTYLTEGEATALINAPTNSNRTGRRGRALLATAITTGMRVSELTGLTWADLHLGAGAHAVCHGKGRKNRATPLDKTTTRALKHWQSELQPAMADPVFPTQTGTPMSNDAVAQRVTKAATTAAVTCPTIQNKTITPHVLRHTTAMRLLHAGIDTSVIALWLGHASTETTQIYIHADMTMKDEALDRLKPAGTKSGRYKPNPAQLAFLEQL
ncbi:tyrosine-type recombinase/integrase [Arthrobacter psychrolactophilus]